MSKLCRAIRLLTHSTMNLEDNAPFQDWFDEAKEFTQLMKSEKYDKYVDYSMYRECQGKGLWTVKRNIFDRFENVLLNYPSPSASLSPKDPTKPSKKRNSALV